MRARMSYERGSLPVSKDALSASKKKIAECSVRAKKTHHWMCGGKLARNSFPAGSAKMGEVSYRTLSVFLTPNNVVAYKDETGKHVCFHSSEKEDPCT